MAKKVLVVDDEPDLLKVAVFRLKKTGYTILTAVDGQQALDYIQKETPDLILLDLLLPVIDGCEVCRRIKEDDTLKHIPVILFTASAIDVQEKAKEAGADDYIVKPFAPDELLKKVENFIGPNA